MKQLIVLLSCIICSTYARQEAITIVPVADLLGTSASMPSTRQTIQFYQQLPICGNNSFSDPRTHQLLFHERVWIEQAVGPEVRVTVPNVFYQLPDGQIGTSYWSLKKNFVLIKDLKERRVNTNLIPPAIQFVQKKTVTPQESIITLKKPYYCKQFDLHFSAGTRFIKSDKEQNGCITVFALNPCSFVVEKISIPHEYVLESAADKVAKRKLFIRLLKEWANTSDGFIPYVWGGCSFTQHCNTEFVQKKRLGSTYYDRTNLAKPFGGFDCSGLIWRAAQACGIPLFCKNSYTFEQQLKPLTNQQQIQPGDIIWFPGHVMIIADLEQHLTIEARSYSHGYGKVHCLPLSCVFKNIHSIQDLLGAYHAAKKLERLNSAGTVVQTIPLFKILRLDTVWF